MPHSLSKLYIHLVFNTKYKAKSIPTEHLSALHAYIAGICKQLSCEPKSVGGVENHVHVLCELSRSVSVSQLVKEIKVSSSKWLKQVSTSCGLFCWQAGYGVFSVSESMVGRVDRYIEGQREHHGYG